MALCRKVRIGDGLRKKIWQERPSSNGGWQTGTEGVRRVLYNTDKLAKAQPGSLVLIHEGEPHCDRSAELGYLAVTNPEGAAKPEQRQKWRKKYSEQLRGFDVVLFPDNDAPGRTRVDHIAKSLQGIAHRVRVLSLPGLPPKGDILDWLAAGHDAIELQQLIEAAPEWTCEAEKESAKAPETHSAVDSRVRIEVDDLDIPTIADTAWAAVIGANSPPSLFRRAGLLARLERSDSGALAVVSVDRRRMRGILARECVFTQVKHNLIAIVDPPSVIIDDTLVNPATGLPIINHIVRSPIFAPDATLLDEPGYHETARVYYDPDPHLIIPALPAELSEEDMTRARSLILDDLLCDFPFVSDADRAHAISLLLLPFVREVIAGSTPINVIEAPTMGSGKGLLADVLLLPALGEPPVPMEKATEEGEWRKRITSTLLEGPTVVLIDNLTRPLTSGALAAALTAREWTDRRLGVSEMVRADVRCVWVATGNNVILSSEIARRSIRIRIDPRLEKPWKRTEFRHPKLRLWVTEHRGELVHAAIVLVRYGLGHGKATATLGSYEQWAAVMGRILNGCGILGFLGNLDELYERADVETAAWRALVTAWWNIHQEAEVTAYMLYTLLTESEIDLPLRGTTDKACRISFGRALVRMKDRVLTVLDTNENAVPVQIVNTGESHKVKTWRLKPTGEWESCG